ncbi:hypothetical protein CDD81_7705 [Ophiocordyceps australis]|uniref:Uncharacterized protein n=1 Tax=Ophiocordyceps australis TaxID=1399860 RepID=A0A2C5Y2Q8_9HYPO|nr:hypothetical protein CDD81_7705 [Ophiocordyceps australis]
MAEADASEFARFLTINVTGTFNVTRAVSAAMKSQEARPVTVSASCTAVERGVCRGAIVNLGSASSYVATPGLVHYTTSKHAVLGLSKNAALDNIAHGIRVNCLCPTWVDTPMVQKAMASLPDLEPMIKALVPMGRIACVQEVADAALFMCSPRSSYITGSGLILDGGATIARNT